MHASPSPLGAQRVVGLVFLLLLALGPFVYMITPEAVMVSGDADATARELLAHADQFRWSMVAEFGIAAAELAMVAALFLLFRPVSEGLALVAAGARFVMAVVMGVSVMPGLGALRVAESSPSLSMAMLEMRADSVVVWQVFFGMHLLLFGVLVFRSGFLPRVFGLMLGAAGIGYLVDTLGNMVAPEYAEIYATVVLVAAMVGEVPVFLWMLVKGVDVAAWQRRVVSWRGARDSAQLVEASSVAA